ncbi:MAG: PDZ domain-containing protein, partial [bacterium]|nr:PDZ domain-containing protein [bacterium]
VIGINSAMSVEGENIGFAIPINKAKKDDESFKASGEIALPFLGVRYVLISQDIAQKNSLPVNYGIWIQKGGNGEAAVYAGSPAEKAGIQEGDIILEFAGEKITADNTLSKVIMKYNPGDKVILKILKQGQEKNIEVTLDKRS